MPVFNKPQKVNNVWASDGDKVYAGDEKTGLGWIEEVPPHENFNYIDYKQDAYIAHANQFGIPKWDGETEYQGGYSITMGSNGVVYRALINSINQDPTTAVQGYWEVLPLSVDSGVSLKRYIGYQLYASDFTAQVNTRYYATTLLTSTLPLEHEAGDVVTYAKSPTIYINIKANGCLIITSLGSTTDVDFDLNDEINLVSNGTNWEV